MSSSWEASIRSNSTTRWLVAGGEGADPRDGERDREGERPRPPRITFSGDPPPPPSWEGEGSRASLDKGPWESAVKSAIVGVTGRAAGRPRPLQEETGAENERAGAPEDRRNLPVDGGMTPNASTCSSVSGHKADWGPERGKPYKVRSLHWTRSESLPGSRVSPLTTAAYICFAGAMMRSSLPRSG
jgi:hypothetical protein